MWNKCFHTVGLSPDDLVLFAVYLIYLNASNLMVLFAWNLKNGCTQEQDLNLQRSCSYSIVVDWFAHYCLLQHGRNLIQIIPSILWCCTRFCSYTSDAAIICAEVQGSRAHRDGKNARAQGQTGAHMGPLDPGPWKASYASVLYSYTPFIISYITPFRSLIKASLVDHYLFSGNTKLLSLSLPDSKVVTQISSYLASNLLCLLKLNSDL